MKGTWERKEELLKEGLEPRYEEKDYIPSSSERPLLTALNEKVGTLNLLINSQGTG